MAERELSDLEAVEVLVQRLDREEAEADSGATWRCVGGAVTETRLLTVVDPGRSKSAWGVYSYPEDTGQIGIDKTRCAVVVKTEADDYYRSLFERTSVVTSPRFVFRCCILPLTPRRSVPSTADFASVGE